MVVDGGRAAWKWRAPTATWKTEGRDIGWAEAVAFELAVRYLERDGLKNAGGNPGR